MALGVDKIRQIDSLVKDILRDAYGDKQVLPPINLKHILDKYDIQLKSGDFKDKDILGAYDKRERTIYVNSSEEYPRKAFTIAHELGHFFLHEEKKSEFFYRSDVLRMEQDKSEETEANEFAATLLMPSFLVERFWKQFRSVGIIAHIFRVSHTAATFRLKNLNLID